MGEFKNSLLSVPKLQAGCFATERLTEQHSGKALHPCQKPIATVLPFVLRLPIKSAIDPFIGTGTTGVACVRAEVAFTGFERDEAYFCIAQKRISEAKGQGVLDWTDSPA